MVQEESPLASPSLGPCRVRSGGLPPGPIQSRRMRSLFLSLSLCLLAAPHLRADFALLVGEPYGRFGAFNPTGHASLYLDRVCLDGGHTRLRLCEAGEEGVVLSRYHRVAGYDWIAIPATAYFYATDSLGDVPAFVTSSSLAALRDEYRRRNLRSLIPDGPGGAMPEGDWIQLVGSSYERRIYGFRVPTTRAADEALIARLNADSNVSRFHLLWRNCADFATSIINGYYPGALRRSLLADVGITTPKNIARRLLKYARRHEIEVESFVIPQITGVERSTKVRGVAESLLLSKKYVVPIVFVSPWIAGGLLAGYIANGRFNPQSTDPVELMTPDHRLPGLGELAIIHTATLP